MVAGYGKVVANLVHNVYQESAVRKRADGASLNGVAGIHQCNILFAVLSLHFSLVGCNAGIADGIVDGAVHIVGVQNYDFVIVRAGRRCFLGACGKNHGNSQNSG